MDIGGHRFFSKSDRVMRWWLDMMPVEAGARSRRRPTPLSGPAARYSRAAAAPDPQTEDLVMLVRQRKSRIYFLRRFFDYPIRLSRDTFMNLGSFAPFVAASVTCAPLCFPSAKRSPSKTFIINRFGKQLYLTFFKSYTEKVWGVPCDEISAEWGAQRIKGLSLKGVIMHFLKKTFARKASGDIGPEADRDFADREIPLSQVRPRPAMGTCCRIGREARRRNSLRHSVDRIHLKAAHRSIEGVNEAGERVTFAGDYFFSTMPVRDLIRAILRRCPAEVRRS